MPKMGDLAAQDSYGAVDWSRMNQPFGQLLDPNPKLYDTKAGPIYQADINQAIDVAMAASGGGLATKGIKAYHSSPHDFEKFDLSKIGTGEGAQVYGHGLYFAENPAVSGQGGRYWNQFLSRFGGNEEKAASALRATKFDREAAIADSALNISQLKDYLAHGRFPEPAKYGSSRDYYEHLLRERQAQHDLLTSDKPVGPRTYEVDIKADPAQMLNWDKPIEHQEAWKRLHPEVRNAIDKAMEERMMNPMSDALEAYTGKELYKVLKHHDVHEALPAELPGSSWYTGHTTEAKHTAAYLESLGIPGIKYLDEGSRRGLQRPAITPSPVLGNVPILETLPHPSPTSNYVVFDPSIVDIMKKYGIAGAAPAAMGALAAQDSYKGD